MKSKTSSITFVAATVLSVGVLAGCEYCQPLLLATVTYMAIKPWLPKTNNKQTISYAS
jgi:hypothetical protein